VSQSYRVRILIKYLSRTVIYMRVLKIFLAFSCISSLAWFIVGLQAKYSPLSEAFPPSHRNLRLASSLTLALVYAVALYGLHKRTLVAWRFGWLFLAAAWVEFLVMALSSTLKSPEFDTLIASAAIVFGSSAVVVYWGLWWKRQRNYFMAANSAARSKHPPCQGNC
jgi:hypothetical protein